MTQPVKRAKPSAAAATTTTSDSVAPLAPPAEPIVATPTGKIFLGEEDRRLLKKFTSHIVKKLDLGSNRSIKM